MSEQEQYYTAREVADRLNLNRIAVYRLARSGQLPVVKSERRLRFDPRDVEAFVASRRTGTREAA